LFYYRLAGLVALVALAVEGVLLFGLLAMFGAVLTLPGIAGIILSLGMAIDANVLIYERLREEIKVGKSLRTALDASYQKAFSAIFDSHVTTLITAAILYFLATGPVRGFAVTLTMGIIASMFTALVITRNLFSWLFHFNLLRRITMADLIADTNIDFLGKRRTAMIVSGIAIALLAVVFIQRGAHNFGVDFRGGDRLVLEAQGQKVTEAQVRDALADLKLADAVVQKETSATAEFMTIRSPLDTSDEVDAHLKAQLPQAQFRTEASEKVGSLVGQELIRKSLTALGLGLLGILIYVAVRFELSFAIGAIVALLHDLLITIGLYSLAGREISLIFVGAILTVAGYSVNDKIVVFDRIREGIRSERKGSVQEIMNRSINETLSRTLLTGGTTLLALAALYFFGGPVLNDFAFSIFVGVIVGTFSSIYIAPPIVLWWSRLKGKSLQREIKEAESRQEAKLARV
ncbi:MAG TPA: protein translocase subunit SecF, partial [Chthoniobacterales bacterium]|nr:protein translocase subunit SecF [Chthoniobacterales bacterium]